MARPAQLVLTTTSINEDPSFDSMPNEFYTERSVSPESFIPKETRPNTKTNSSTTFRRRSYFDDSLESQLLAANSLVSALTLEIKLLEKQNLNYEGQIKRLKAEFAHEILCLKTNHEYKVGGVKAKYHKKIQNQEKEHLRYMRMLCESDTYDSYRNRSQKRLSCSRVSLENKANDRTVLLLLSKKLKAIAEGPQNIAEEQLKLCIDRIE